MRGRRAGVAGTEGMVGGVEGVGGLDLPVTVSSEVLCELSDNMLSLEGRRSNGGVDNIEGSFMRSALGVGSVPDSSRR